MLNLYRAALGVRRADHDLASGSLDWLPSPARTVMFRRGASFVCAVNLGADAVALPAGRTTVLRSDHDGRFDLPPETAEWFLDQARDGQDPDAGPVIPEPPPTRIRRGT